MTETTEEDAYTRADKASLITEEQRQAYSATRDRIRAEYLFSREHRPPTTGRTTPRISARPVPGGTYTPFDASPDVMRSSRPDDQFP